VIVLYLKNSFTFDLSNTHKHTKMTTIQIAKQKASTLRTNSMIRLNASATSLWVYNVRGRLMIGYPVSEPAAELMDVSKKRYEMKNKSGNVTDIVQFL
jgi:hypothetical protein